MGWWAIGDDEVVGDGPADISAAAFKKLVQTRTEAAKPALHYEDIITLLAVTVGRSSRELAPRKDAKFVGMITTFDGGAAEIRTDLDPALKPPPEEVAILREWAKNVSNEYKELSVERGRRRPSARELLEAAAFVLRPIPNEYLAEDEKRVLKSFTPIYEHSEGQISAEELISIVAASLRRNERRLGLMVHGGAAMAPEVVIAVTADGREIKTSVATAQATREQVDDMCEGFDNAISEHRDEKSEAYLAKLNPSDREKLQRNSDARGLPTLEQLIENTRKRLARTPERWFPLQSMRVETSERSGIGLPSRPPPAKFVDSRLRVRHAKFGEGFVERTFEDGDKKYEVIFDGGKRITLMARFLDVVDPSARSEAERGSVSDHQGAPAAAAPAKAPARAAAAAPPPASSPEPEAPTSEEVAPTEASPAVAAPAAEDGGAPEATSTETDPEKPATSDAT